MILNRLDHVQHIMKEIQWRQREVYAKTVMNQFGAEPKSFACYIRQFSVCYVRILAWKSTNMLELQSGELDLLHIFSECALNQLEKNPLFYRDITFNNEAQFWFNRYYDK